MDLGGFVLWVAWLVLGWLRFSVSRGVRVGWVVLLLGACDGWSGALGGFGWFYLVGLSGLLSGTIHLGHQLLGPQEHVAIWMLRSYVLLLICDRECDRVMRWCSKLGAVKMLDVSVGARLQCTSIISARGN